MNAQVKTLDDLAQLCGVSASTISRVFSNDPKISRETRQRVLDIAKQHDYVPNRRKRPISNRDLRILLITPRPSPMAPHVMDEAVALFEGLAEAFSGCRRRLEVMNIEELENLISKGRREGDGIVSVFQTIDDELKEALDEAGIPMVHINRTKAPYVTSNDFKGFTMLCEHLKSKGYQRPAFLGWKGHPRSQERLMAYLGALHAIFDKVDPIMEFVEAPEEMSVSLLQSVKKQGADAVMAFNDIIALRAMSTAADGGFAIPGDLAFTGFDDIPAAALTHPRLTTVKLPIYNISRLAGLWLRDAIRDRETPPLSLEVVGHLVKGNST